MDKWGYTGSACVPMALDDAVAQGRIAAGDLVVLCASGGGIAMAAAAIRWT
jgi:3-oxoacyl-[acyl-carrier-protein] synthase-3